MKPIIKKTPQSQPQKKEGTVGMVSGSSGNSSGSRNLATKKNLFPVVKTNPSAIRIKGSGSSNSGSTTMQRQPLIVTRDPQSNTSDSADELEMEILDSLYTRYLRLRLMAQKLLKTHAKLLEENTDELARVCMGKLLDKESFTAQVKSAKDCLAEVKMLLYAQNTSESLEPLVETVLSAQSATKCDDLESNLSRVLDHLPVRGVQISPSNSGESDIKLNELREFISKELENQQSSLGFLQQVVQCQNELQHLSESTKNEDKDFNNELILAASLKISEGWLAEQKNNCK